MTDDLASTLVWANGLWLGSISSSFGPLELVIDGTEDGPDEQHLAALRGFLSRAGDAVHKLRRKLPLSFLWCPVRLAPNDQNRVGVQFQHRLLNRRELLFADEMNV